MKMFDLVFKQFDEMVEDKKKDKSITKKKTKNNYIAETGMGMGNGMGAL